MCGSLTEDVAAVTGSQVDGRPRIRGGQVSELTDVQLSQPATIEHSHGT